MGNPEAELLVGSGDDAACFWMGDELAVVTTDAMHEGTHFDFAWCSWEDLGWRATSATLSDIAAMGAIPLYIVASLGLPKGVNAEQIDALHRGIKASLSNTDGECKCVGGDLIQSEKVFVSLTAIGKARKDLHGNVRLLRRDEARVGDVAAVTDTLGDAAAGLQLLLAGRRPKDAHSSRISRLFRAFLHPTAKIATGKVLIDAGVSCGIDISDGVVADASKIAVASQVAIELHSEAMPVSQELTETFADTATDKAFSGGEGFQLLFTTNRATAQKVLAVLGTGAVIGEVQQSTKNGRGIGVRVVDKNGKELPLKTTGWDHFEG